MNLLVAFAVALKHSLRFEPYTAYPDLQNLIGHLTTFAKDATTEDASSYKVPKKNFFKSVGEYLGVSFAASNPRKTLKKASRPLGNLPLEVLNHLAVTIDDMVRNDQLKIPMQQTLAYNNLSALNDVMTGCERVLNTPLPIAYTIVISQITWVYVVLLPFQLVKSVQWVTIPATLAASYIILGLLFIGREIENPFGQDVNDLPLDGFCDQIAAELDIIASYDMQNPCGFLMSADNMPLYPVSTASAGAWMHRSEEKLRETIRTKPATTFEWRRARNQRPGSTNKLAEHIV
jgi:predicted membrane chloride channel (bestrophin family)